MSVSLGPMPKTVRGLRARYGTLVKRVEDAKFIGWQLMEQHFAAELAATAQALKQMRAPLPKHAPPKPLGPAVPGQSLDDLRAALRRPRRRKAYAPQPGSLPHRIVQAMPAKAVTCAQVERAVRSNGVEDVREALKRLCQHGWVQKVPSQNDNRRVAYRLLKGCTT